MEKQPTQCEKPTPIASMENQPTQSEKPTPTASMENPDATSCQKHKKKDNATFLEDVKDRIDVFFHTSFKEHKDCFSKTMQKMLTMTKVAAERNPKVEEVDSSVPLHSSVAE